MASSSFNKPLSNNEVVNVVSPSYIGKSIISGRNDQLTFTNGIATKDISNIYNGTEAFGFFFFPYNSNAVGVMHIRVTNGVAEFNTEGTTLQGQYYVNWMIFLPKISA